MKSLTNKDDIGIRGSTKVNPIGLKALSGKEVDDYIKTIKEYYKHATVE